MKRNFFITVVLFVFLAGLLSEFPVQAKEAFFTQEELDCIANAGTLKVGYVADRIPISFQNQATGDFDGVSRALFDRISELSGLCFEYVALPAGSVTYDYLREQSFDLVTSVEYNEANAHARGILMSEPYLSTRKVIIGKPDLSFDMSEHLKIAIATGSQTIKQVLAEQYPNFEIVDYDSIEHCFDAVKKQEADLLILNQYVAEFWLNKPVYEDLQVIPFLGLDDKLCFSAVVSLEHTDEKEWTEKETIIDIINKTVGAITQDEIANFIIMETLDHQYNYNLSDFAYRYRYSIAGLIFILILICGLIFVSIYLYMKTLNARAEAKAKDQFLSMMSHEIRTPLNGLIGLNYLMAQNIDRHEKLTSYLRQSSSTAHYLLSLVNNILDMSKFQKNKTEVSHNPFSLPTLIETIDVIERKHMEYKGIVFSIQTDIPHPVLLGDEVRVQQVILNLLDNACKFTNSSGHVTMKVTQTPLGKDRVSTRIEVSDTGCGMSTEFLEKIFDSFTRELNTVSKGNQGTGLGMSISYQLAKLMKGDLTVESHPGEGSRFVFQFPAEISTEEAPRRKPEITDPRGEFIVPLPDVRRPFDRGAGTGIHSADNKPNPSQDGVNPAADKRPEKDAHPADDSRSDVRSHDSANNPEKKTPKESAGSISCPEEPARKILIAEDNELNAEILIDLLEEEGYSVVLAENGLIAANIFSVSAPGEFSHILMDLMMPVMNGFETTEMIRRMARPDAKTVRIYACTANSSPADRERAKQCGMDNFLAKPIDIGQLLDLLEK